MKINLYTGSISERQDAGKGKGEFLVWGGRQYHYVCYVENCKKEFKSLKTLEDHRIIEHYR